MLTNSDINLIIIRIRKSYKGVAEMKKSTKEFWQNADKIGELGEKLEKKLIKLYNSGPIREML